MLRTHSWTVKRHLRECLFGYKGAHTNRSAGRTPKARVQDFLSGSKVVGNSLQKDLTKRLKCDGSAPVEMFVKSGHGTLLLGLTGLCSLLRVTPIEMFK